MKDYLAFSQLESRMKGLRDEVNALLALITREKMHRRALKERKVGIDQLKASMDPFYAHINEALETLIAEMTAMRAKLTNGAPREGSPAFQELWYSVAINVDDEAGHGELEANCDWNVWDGQANGGANVLNVWAGDHILVENAKEAVQNGAYIVHDLQTSNGNDLRLAVTLKGSDHAGKAPNGVDNDPDNYDWTITITQTRDADG